MVKGTPAGGPELPPLIRGKNDGCNEPAVQSFNPLHYRLFFMNNLLKITDIKNCASLRNLRYRHGLVSMR